MLNHDRCQHCGQRLPPMRLPEGWFKSNTIKRRIWDAVTSWPGMTATELMDWCYGHDPNGGPDSQNIISVHVNQMNKSLKTIGLKIKGDRFTGYIVQKLED